ncbi:unnamed protein product [Trichobilharzia regenti]|nr:unnamed protein product [Trichobilharzia regenti]
MAKPTGNTSNRLFVPSKWETVETIEPEITASTNIWESASITETENNESNDNIQSTPSRQQKQTNGLSLAASYASDEADGIPIDTSRWSNNSPTNKVDDDVDGEPLQVCGGLVAYDDEDAASPVPSESSLSPTVPVQVSQTVCSSLTSTVTHVTSAPSTSSTTVSEERRAILREVELKVLKYQDELEASRKGDKTVTDEAINKVSKFLGT